MTIYRLVLRIRKARRKQHRPLQQTTPFGDECQSQNAIVARFSETFPKRLDPEVLVCVTSESVADRLENGVALLTSASTGNSTITAQIASRAGYLEEFLRYWSGNPAIAKIWFSLFTPQRGATDPEILSPSQRVAVMKELRRLRPLYPKLDMHDLLIDEIATPPSDPSACIFARTTETISADLKTQITPCQFGGDPDCSQCGCIASMGLAAVGHYKVAGRLTAGHLFIASDSLGKHWRKFQNVFSRKTAPASMPAPFNILQN